MFKKALETKARSRLSGADRKKFKRSIRERFPGASDAEIDLILPPKAEVTMTRLHNRAIVYGTEGGFPMFFDINGRGTEIFPTVFALWTVPELLPAFILKGGEVSRFIVGGADLMFPGISVPSEGLPSFSPGQSWAVKIPGNPAPIAVGITTMSNVEASQSNLRGKALRIMHYYRDSLWDSVEGHQVPNAGFLEDAVFADPAFLSPSQICDVVSESNNLVHGLNNGDDADLAFVSHSSRDVDGSECIDDTNVVNIEITAGVKDLQLADSIEESSDRKDESMPSVEEMDTLLDRCLLQALHTTVKEKDLPMSGSTLWSGHVLPCRPPSVILDVKRSSHKKLAKWLQSKFVSELITTKEDRHKKEVLIVSVHRNHPEYTSFRPEKRKPDGCYADSSAGEGLRSKPKLEIAELYKSSPYVNPILTAVGADLAKYYTASEASSFVFMYVEKENLVNKTEKARVVLDALLCDALYKGTIKKGTAYPTEIHKKDLGSAFVGRMHVYHCVTRGAENVLRKGSVRTVQIVTERRQGNKKVTKVSGFESFLLEAETLASELQKKFACSTSVSELPGKKGQHEVLIQGAVIDDLARHLMEHYDIPKRYIEVLDKTHK